MSDIQTRILQDNLNKLLRQKGKSQRELADAIEESAQVVNTWFQGKSFPRIAKLKKLADYFDTTIPELLKPMEKDISHARRILEEISPIEYQILKNYRQLSETEQNMILRMLGIEEKKDEENFA